MSFEKKLKISKKGGQISSMEVNLVNFGSNLTKAQNIGGIVKGKEISSNLNSFRQTLSSGLKTNLLEKKINKNLGLKKTIKGNSNEKDYLPKFRTSKNSRKLSFFYNC